MGVTNGGHTTSTQPTGRGRLSTFITLCKDIYNGFQGQWLKDEVLSVDGCAKTIRKSECSFLSMPWFA